MISSNTALDLLLKTAEKGSAEDEIKNNTTT